MEDTQTKFNNNHHHGEHSHHHASHHKMDDSEKFKQQQLRGIRIRKKLAKITYTIMWIAAIVVMLGVFYAYFIEP